MLPFQYLKILNGTVYQSIVFHMNKKLGDQLSVLL